MSAAFTGIGWLFFDVGYTLFDETPAWQKRFEAVAAQLHTWGRAVSVDDVWQTYRDVCEQYEPMQWAGLCDRLAKSPDEAETLKTLSKGWKHSLEQAYPETGELLRSLHSRYKIGVIANQSAGTADRLRERGLLPFVDLVVGSAEAGVRKPDPKIFHMALMKAGCDATAAVMIGDRIDNDIAPAKALGMKTIHVRQGGSALQKPRSAAETADATIDRLIDLKDLLLPDRA